MAALADPQDQGNWPSLSFEGSGAQNGSKEKGAGNKSLAGAGSSSTKPLGEQLAEEHKKRLHRFIHQEDSEYKISANRTKGLLYASATHSHPSATGKQSEWNRPKNTRSEPSYYEQIQKRVARNELRHTDNKHESNAVHSWAKLLHKPVSEVLATANDPHLSRRTSVTYKDDRDAWSSTHHYKDFLNVPSQESWTYKKSKEFSNYMDIVTKTQQKASEFHAKNQDKGFDVIANGGAPISHGAASLHKARQRDAAVREDERYWTTHAHVTHRGKNNAWNTQDPAFTPRVYSRKERNPAPGRIRLQMQRARQRIKLVAQRHASSSSANKNRR